MNVNARYSLTSHYGDWRRLTPTSCVGIICPQITISPYINLIVVAWGDINSVISLIISLSGCNYVICIIKLDVNICIGDWRRASDLISCPEIEPVSVSANGACVGAATAALAGLKNALNPRMTATKRFVTLDIPRGNWFVYMLPSRKQRL
jgi:hypothetical protein